MISAVVATSYAVCMPAEKKTVDLKKKKLAPVKLSGC